MVIHLMILSGVVYVLKRMNWLSHTIKKLKIINCKLIIFIALDNGWINDRKIFILHHKLFRMMLWLFVKYIVLQ